MIEVKDLTKTFHDKKAGDVYAVNHVNFVVNKGEIFGLLGPNGAGKTTLLRMLSTIMTPDSGTAIINGYDVQTHPEDVKRSIGFLSGNTKLYKKLTPIETMKFFGSFYGIDKVNLNKRIEQIIHDLDMESFKNRVIEKLSTGQVQKTSIARCMLHNPQIYILDEPTLGLDILTSRAIIDFIQREKTHGKTIIFSTHYMEEADALCDRIGLIHLGELIQTGTLDDLKAKTGKHNIREIFLHYIDQEKATRDAILEA
jgi:sodium transport system ATP-binding protein